MNESWVTWQMKESCHVWMSAQIFWTLLWLPQMWCTWYVSWVMSHLNESRVIWHRNESCLICHIWMSAQIFWSLLRLPQMWCTWYISWVMSHMNESWVMSPRNESCHVWMCANFFCTCHVTSEWVKLQKCSAYAISHVIYEWVMSHMNVFLNPTTTVSNVVRVVRVMSHTNESCHVRAVHML